jgi:hypothetical protein
LGADVLRKEISMLAQAIARALDLDHNRMVEQTIEKCGRNDWIAGDLAVSSHTRICEIRRHPHLRTAERLGWSGRGPQESARPDQPVYAEIRRGRV